MLATIESININDLTEVARVLKSHGVDGQLILGFKDFYPEDIKIEEPLFFIIDGIAVPFFIEKYDIKGKKAFVKIQDIDNIQYADSFTGQSVYISYNIDGQQDEDYIDIIGWKIYDQNNTYIGIVTNYEDIPNNLCIYINSENYGEVLVPFNDSLILSINYDKETIKLAIPEGLF